MTGLLSVAGSTPSDEGFELKSTRFDDGSSSYMERTPSSAGNRKTWTWSCWAKRASGFGSDQQLFNAWEDDSNRFSFIFSNSANQLQVYELISGTDAWNISSNAVYRDPGAWQHIMLVRDATNNVAADRGKIYVNGLQIDVTAATTLSDVDGIANKAILHSIGKENHSTGNYSFMDGYLAEVYFIDGQALTPASFAETNEDTNQWQPKNPTDIKPTVTFGTNGYYLPFSNDALDDSFAGNTSHSIHTVTPSSGSNPHTDTTIKKFGTASGQWNNSTYLSAPDSIDWCFGDGDYSIDFWLYHTSHCSTDHFDFIISQPHASGSNQSYIGTRRAASGSYYMMSNFSGQSSQSNSDITIALDTWAHYAICKDGSTVYFYKDGVSVMGVGVGSGGATVAWPNYAVPLRIGYQQDVEYYNGYADEIRISKGIARYPSGTTFSVPTSAHTADEYDVLLLHCDGSDSGTTFTDSSWNGAVPFSKIPNNLTVAGDTANTRIQPNSRMVAQGAVRIIGPKVGSSAIAFDGDGDYLSVASSTDFDFGTGDFTLEMWCNSTNLLTTTHVYLFDMRDGTSRITITSNIASSNGIWFGDGWSNITDWAFPSDEWFHIAVCRQSGTGRAYLNGVLKSSVSSFTTNFGGTWTTHIGDKYDNGPDAELEGYLDEIRLSNIARYPDGTTFTPSTTAFTSDANTKLLIHSNTTMGSTIFTDSSSGAHTITAVGAMKNVAPKIGTGMGVWDGVLSPPTYIETATAPTTWAFGTQDFTWDFWAYADAWTNNDTFYEAYAASTDRWELRIKTGGDLALESIVGGSTVVDLDFDNANMPTGAWFHLEISRSGSTFRCFINGTETGDAQTSSGSMGTAARQLKIGRSGQHNTVWEGYMDEHRMSKGIVRHTSNFTPSTTAFKDDVNTALLLHMDGGGGIDPETNLPTLAGQGTYFWDDSTNAIFYGADGIPTNKSLVNFPGNGYLSVPSSSDFDFGTGDWTIECWMWLTKSQTNRSLYTQGVSGQNPGAQFEFNSSTGKIGYYEYALESNWDTYVESTDAIPFGEWLHFAIVRNSLIFTMYINGVAQTAPNTSNNSIGTPPAGPQWGYHRSDSARYLDDVYLDQMRISNSARYTSAFTPSTTPFTTDANTKLLIQSDFSEGGLGADHSGNYNYWTPTNLGVDDMMLDSPMNNFCTLNPLPANYGAGPRNTYQTMSEGNLKTMGNTATDSANVSSTIAFAEGKWYFECYVVGVSASYNYPRIGMIDTPNTGLPSRLAGEANTLGVTYQTNGEKGIAGTFSSYGDTFTTGDVVGMAIDADNGAAYFSKNGTWQNSGVPTSGASKTNAAYTYTGGSIEFTPSWIPYTSAGGGVANFGQDSSFAGNLTAQGNQDGNSKGDFFYAPPAGFLALCMDNLPDPLISAVEALDHFNTVAYSGDGTTPRTLNAGFQPDFTWLKIRTVAWSHRLFDSIRGANLALYSNSNAVQAAGTSGYLSGFASTGPTFTGNGADVRDVNETGDTYVTWNWKAGGAPTVDNSAGAGNTPTAGSVKINGSNLGSALAGSIATTRLSANTTAGFSISTYTGNATAGATIAHGLSQAPDIAFFKELTYVDNWVVFAEPLGNTKALFLDTANDAGTHLTYWNDTSPNATVITLGTDGKANSARTHIMYAFHSVDGYSKVGSYTGNGNADGTFVYTGFRPAYVLWKSTTASENWQIKDNKRLGYNQQNHTLFANDTAIDYTTAYVDLVSNGFKLRISGGGSNGTNEVLMYLAFAESPFKTSNAR